MGKGFAAVGRDVVGPLIRVFGEDGWPAGHVDVDVLGVFVVSEEWLSVFPAVEACDFSKRGLDDVVQRLALAVAVDGALDVGGLDLSTVEDNGTGFVDEGLPMSANNVIIHKM